MTRRNDTEIQNVLADYQEAAFTVLASGTTISASFTTTTFDNLMYRGLRLFFDAGAWALSATASASARVQIFDAQSARYFNLVGANTISFNPTASSTFVVLTIFPGADAVVNEVVNNHIGFRWRLVIDVVAGATTDNFILGIGGQYLR